MAQILLHVPCLPPYPLLCGKPGRNKCFSLWELFGLRQSPVIGRTTPVAWRQHFDDLVQTLWWLSGRGAAQGGPAHLGLHLASGPSQGPFQVCLGLGGLFYTTFHVPLQPQCQLSSRDLLFSPPPGPEFLSLLLLCVCVCARALSHFSHVQLYATHGL